MLKSEVEGEGRVAQGLLQVILPFCQREFLALFWGGPTWLVLHVRLLIELNPVLIGLSLLSMLAKPTRWGSVVSPSHAKAAFFLA